MEIPLVHWIQWTNKIPMDISRSIGSIGSNVHFRLAISMAQYLHEVHGLVITSFKYMVIDQLKKQMSDGNSTCPLNPTDKQNSKGHFQVHWIHWIQWTLSFGYLNGTVSTWGPWACRYVIQIHGYWPTEKENVSWKFPLSIGSNGQKKIPMDIFRSTGSIGSNGHFRLAISMAQYLHEVHGLVVTSFKFMVIDKLKKQMSDGNSTCPLDPMDKQNSNGHFQVHWIHWIQWTLSFGYLNGTVSTWGP